MTDLYDPALEREWCGDYEDNTTVADFRAFMHERRRHPLHGHHFVPYLSHDEALLGQACWYCGLTRLDKPGIMGR